MSSNPFGMQATALAGHDERAAGNTWQARTDNLYDSAVLPQRAVASRAALGQVRPSVSNSPLVPDQENPMNLFRTVRPNIVQSIRAFRVPDLARAAEALGQHFLYANCAQALTKAEVLDSIAQSFTFPKHFGKNFDALSDCLTDMIAQAGQQPGFVVVLEGLPCTPKFDKEARETLLDVFRDAAEFWAERKIQFRVFYAFV